jgi:phage major head subunit gpT-like protein
LSAPEKHFPDQVLDAADRQSRHVSLARILMRAACVGGYHAMQGESISQGNLRSVLSAVFQPSMQAGFSTLSIPNVLSNVANKFLLDGFQEMPSEWRSISKIVPVNDFKTHTFVRLLDDLAFEEVGSGGELTHGTLADATMTAQAYTYGRMLAITRQQIINDDLGALSDVPRRLGRAAAQKFNSLYWTKFLAADNFFHSSNGNVMDGAADMTTAGLAHGLQVFRAQRSSTADGSKLIGGKPAILLVPPALEISARALLTSTGFVTGANTTIPSGNPFANLAQLVVVDQIAASEGGSDIIWYFFRAPGFAPAMLVAALNGRVEPTVETADADFATLGIQMRGYCDVGVSRGEPLCGLQADGGAS